VEPIDGTDVSHMIASQGTLPPDYAPAITAHFCGVLNYQARSCPAGCANFRRLLHFDG
jgi:hypothetical protein